MITAEQILEIVIVIVAIRLSRYMFNKFYNKKSDDRDKE